MSRDLAWVAPLLLLHLTVMVTGVGGRPIVQAIDDSIEIIAGLAAAVACFRAAGRFGPRGRRPWRLLGASALSWTLGQCLWSYYECIASGEEPFPSLADIGFLVAVPLGVAALLSFPSRSTQSGRLQAITDGLIIGCALLGFSWITVLHQVARSSGSGFELDLALAYPLGDVMILVITLSVLARATTRHRTTIVAVALGMTCLALADSAFAYLQSIDAYETNLFNTGWVAGYLFIALAARHATDETGAPPSSEPQHYWVLILPFVPTVAFVLAAAAQTAQGQPSPAAAWLGAPLVLLLVIRQLFTHHDNLGLMHALRQQIEALAKSRESLRHQALHDPLTDLPNRTHLMHELQDLYEDPRPQGSALLLLDLDRFKEINDGLGHDVGDQVLAEIADRFRSGTPPGDTVVRLGGDEFAVLIEDASARHRPEDVARGLLAALEDPIEVEGMTLTVGVSIGISHTNETMDATRLLQAADVAMYRAKRLGQDVAVFGPEDDEDRPGRLVLLAELRQMLDQGQLAVHYQPQVDLVTGKAIAVEALARWHHPQHGWIGPEQFIPFAEHTGLIGTLSSLVLHESLAQCARWRDMGLDITMSVNLSPKALQDPHLVHALRNAILDARLPSRHLTLEITESAFAGNTAVLLATLERLRSTGVRLSIDDFGTGYSSMSHLKRLPVDELKIDRCFVTDVSVDRDDEAIVRAVVTLAHTFGLTVVAEGVEDARSLAVVTAIGCDVAQGFHLCRPADADTITDWLIARDTPDIDGIGAGRRAVTTGRADPQ